MSYCRAAFLAVVLFSLAFPQPSLPQAPSSGQLVIRVTGLHSNKGQIQCALYASKEGFPTNKERATAVTRVPIADGQAACTFSELRYGTYAASVFHDENSNGKMDANLLGIPQEGVGASNNATGHLGPPKFADAAFAFHEKQSTVTVIIHYL
jgi:uncharacterized protein (DUF2141 family)